MEPIREYLKTKPLLFDGAMGTYLLSKHPGADPRCELLNLSHPEWVLEIHREYQKAGARALKTNTFGANTVSLECGFDKVEEIIRAGYGLAAAAAGEESYVFADIGPILTENAKEEYRKIADVLLGLGAQNFLFETFPSAGELPEICRYIRKQCPEAFLLTSFAVSPDGFTRQGYSAAQLLREMEPFADGVGCNCVSGPSHLLGLAKELKTSRVLSIMPNSGYPTAVGGRTYFESGADYFAGKMGEMAGCGVRIFGGCCGTTPAHIAATARILEEAEHKNGADSAASAVKSPKTAPKNRFREKLEAGKKVIAVEVDPPANDDGSFFMEAAARLKALGVDAVTVADCPVARVRADAAMLAAKLKRELDMDAIPHMTCRDRNLNAAKALLLGLSMEDVHNILVVTGDPVPSASRDEVKAVFSFNSAMLAGYIRALGEETLGGPFLVAGALNVNAPNFDAELKKAHRKKESGVQMLMTQPVFTEEALQNLRRAKEETGLWILGGLMPPVSYRNACYMHNEISGIRLSEEILERYKDVDREEAGRIGVSLCLETAGKMAPWVDGYYLMTPFQRIDLIEEIVRQLGR